MATNVGDVLNEAEKHLRRHGIRVPRNDALVLLSAATGRRIETLLAHSDLQLAAPDLETYHKWVKKRGRHYPLQYLTGRQEFYGRSFFVSRHVLIPRPETEMVVETCLDFLRTFKRPATVLDIGTGSGCIVLSLLSEIPNLTACAVDISEKILQVAKRNSRDLGCESRLELFRGSTVDPFQGSRRKFDLVVSNPPYVALSDSVEPEVEHEPGTAIFAGPSGLEVYREILEKAACVLTPSGCLVLEIGFGQAEAVHQMATEFGWYELERISDLAGIERCLKLQPLQRRRPSKG